MQKLADFIAENMRKDGLTSIEYGTHDGWRKYEVAWCKKYNRKMMFPNSGYQRVSRALKRSDQFKSTHYILYNRSNGSGMRMPIFDLIEFDNEKGERIFEDFDKTLS